MDRDEILDAVFWFRMLTGLVVGLGAGLLKLTGFIPILTFGVSLFMLSNLYTSRFLEIDESEINEQEMLMEGSGNSLGLFMLSWLLTHNFV